ncbi:MAG TPA: hypothetical protein VFY82_11520 [Acidimicrobiales bacterium]|nr:hypothetical protein [Acidimicrobiales bacterium]
MDDGDGRRSPARRSRARDDRQLPATAVALLAAAVIAVALLAAALASPPASADAPAQAGHGDAAETTAQQPASPGSRGDSRALAWWMVGEVSVLVVGSAIWCRRTNRREAARLATLRAEAPATPTARSGGDDLGGAERRGSPRFRL